MSGYEFLTSELTTHGDAKIRLFGYSGFGSVYWRALLDSCEYWKLESSLLSIRRSYMCVCEMTELLLK